MIWDLLEILALLVAAELFHYFVRRALGRVRVDNDRPRRRR